MFESLLVTGLWNTWMAILMSTVNYLTWTTLSSGLVALVSRSLLICTVVSRNYAFYRNLSHKSLAPGSQNGFDNSGKRGSIGWLQGDTYEPTKNALKALAARYAGDTDVVSAIEALNEPLVPGGVSEDGLKQYYWDSWGLIREASQETTLVLHDGFLPTESWNGFMSESDGVWYVMTDTHHYEVFDSLI